jgi:transposase
MIETDEILLLRKYRSEYDEVGRQIRLLGERHEVLANAIAALEAVLRQKRTDSSPGAGTADARCAATPLGGSKAPDAVLGAVVAVLSDANDSLGAKEIQRRLLGRGLVMPYHSLYRTLKRHAGSSSGLLIRRGENFLLRETGR